MDGYYVELISGTKSVRYHLPITPFPGLRLRDRSENDVQWVVETVIFNIATDTFTCYCNLT